MFNNRVRFRARTRGVGLVEMLIALSISASILTALAVATDASFKAYAINEETSGLMQRDRVALNRIDTYIRTCKQHQPITSALITNFVAGTIVTDTGISMLNDAGTEIDFKFDSVNKKLNMVEAGVTHEMLRGVQTFQVKMEPMQSSTSIKTGGGFDLLKRATLIITVKTTGAMSDIDEGANAQTITLSASVMPRRNAW